jgi:uncharacterized protein (DUF1778 family)
MNHESIKKRHALNMRIQPETMALIDRAAHLRGKNRTDFILDAARLAAEDALLEQSVIHVSPEAYAEFIAILERPAAPNVRLQKTMRASVPWRS